jgi:hypothetical protein
MDAALKRAVKNRAGQRCEYCGMPSSVSLTPFQIDHIIAKKHGGPTAVENLAFCCFHCNIYKGPNVAGIDSQTGAMVSLFNPRRDRWRDHFELRPDGHILGRTEVGRVTVVVLNMNDPDPVVLRACLVSEGRMNPGILP